MENTLNYNDLVQVIWNETPAWKMTFEDLFIIQEGWTNTEWLTEKMGGIDEKLLN
jgi:hypothetical protein